MKLAKKQTVLSLGAVIYLCLAANNDASGADPASVGEALRSASLDGTWSGTTNCLYDPGLWPEDISDTGWNISIDGANAKIEMITRSKSGKEYRSLVDDRPIFVRRLETNAVLTTIYSGNDEDGHWVETWTFSLSLKDKDHLLAHWNRVVNNTDFPINKKASKFSIVEMGELARSAPPTRNPQNAGDADSKAAALAALFLASPKWNVTKKILEGMPDTWSANFRKQFEGRALNRAQQSALDDASRRVADLGREIADPAVVVSLIKNAVERVYTENELKAALAFQSSDEGKSIASKDALLQQELLKGLKERVVKYQPKIKVLICTQN